MKVLYILSTYNVYGGTPKKTLDLMQYFKEQSVLYVYENSFNEFKQNFINTGGKIYEGFFGRNIFGHTKELLKIIDEEKIDIVQTQFSFGETLGFIIKLLRPEIKLIIAFVGTFKPNLIKSQFLSIYYRKVDLFVFISEYVRNEKLKQYPSIAKHRFKIIYNGTEKRNDTSKDHIKMKRYSILTIAGLIELKNIQVLINALNILYNIQGVNNIYLYVVGDGPLRSELELLIKKYSLQENVFLLGYVYNIGNLLDNCDVFVFPSYAEGFGIAVLEAMISEKPIIVSNAGALTELIENDVSGLVVDPFHAEKWADAIIYLINNLGIARNLAVNAKRRAEELFSIDRFCKNYETLYNNLMDY
jgi:glycosyltransferase involved in cell wall biosynthesis